jgi:hypothetical protein
MPFTADYFIKILVNSMSAEKNAEMPPIKRRNRPPIFMPASSQTETAPLGALSVWSRCGSHWQAARKGNGAHDNITSIAAAPAKAGAVRTSIYRGGPHRNNMTFMLDRVHAVDERIRKKDREPEDASDANAVIRELHHLVDTWLHPAEAPAPSKVFTLVRVND